MAGGGKRLFGRHRQDLVIDLGVEDQRHKTGADALDLVRARIAAGQDRAFGWFDGDHFHVGLAFLQHTADAGDRATGADAGHEDIDLTLGIVPDLFGGADAMNLRVGRIFELLGG